MNFIIIICEHCKFMNGLIAEFQEWIEQEKIHTDDTYDWNNDDYDFFKFDSIYLCKMWKFSIFYIFKFE